MTIYFTCDHCGKNIIPDSTSVTACQCNDSFKEFAKNEHAMHERLKRSSGGGRRRRDRGRKR